MKTRKKRRRQVTEGFLFTVLEGGHEREVQLMGNGGLMGNGVLGLGVDLDQATEDVLERARTTLEVEGVLREWRGDHLPPAQRIREFVPDEVIEARPLEW